MDFEHCVRKPGARRVFAGSHNVEIYAVCPTNRERFYVLLAVAEWTSLRINRLLMDPTLLVFAYYKNLVL